MLTEDYKRKAIKKIEGMSNEELKELLKSIGSKPKKDEWIARATHVLQKIEFSGTYIERYDPYNPDSPTWEEHCCPYCGTTERHKRGNICELYRLLKEARGLEGELMNKKDEWITRAVHVLRKVEFSGTELDYGDSDDAWGDPWEDSCCPCCRVVDGHMDDCELHRLLEEAKDIK